MIAFKVRDMTCGHCVSTITKAVTALDAGAEVQIDLATHRVSIDSSAVDALALRNAIQEAGYTPVAIESAAVTGAKAAPAGGGCCCG